MKYLFLIWKNIKRNKRRTILTVLSVAVAIFLFVSIRTVVETMDETVERASATPVLVVEDRYIPLSNNLPEAYLSTLQSIAGVEAVLPVNFVGGTVKGDREEVRFAALDPAAARVVWTDLQQIPEESWKAFVAERRAAIMGQGNMEKFGWHIGDQITLRFFYGSRIDIPLIIVGVSPPGLFGDAGYLQRDYILEVLHSRGKVGMYYLKATDFESSARISTEIDSRFANATVPTRTEPMGKFISRFVSSLGSLQHVISVLVASMLITILAITANTMAMAIRERHVEVAVLKTLGFRRGQVLAMIVGESALMALFGGIIGGMIAYTVLSGLRLPFGGVGAFFVVGAETVAEGLIVAAGIGMLSGFVPGYLAARRSISDGLGKIG